MEEVVEAELDRPAEEVVVEVLLRQFYPHTIRIRNRLYRTV